MVSEEEVRLCACASSDAPSLVLGMSQEKLCAPLKLYLSMTAINIQFSSACAILAASSVLSPEGLLRAPCLAHLAGLTRL